MSQYLQQLCIAIRTYIYRIVGLFRGENFHEFHESIVICENFTLEIFPFETLVQTC